jgi:O-antigen ligase
MSRGSWLACSITFFVGGLMLFRNKSLRKLGLRITGGITAVIIVFLIFIQIGFNPHITERFYSFFNTEKQAEFSDFRIRLWRSTMSAIKEKPWLGYGRGAFEWEMRPFRQERFPYKFDYAHNDYLQFIMECGLLISILALIFLMSCIFSFLRKFSSPTLHYFRFEDFGIFLGIVCLLIHGLVDFNLHIFSNFIFFGLYAGLITKAR